MATMGQAADLASLVSSRGSGAYNGGLLGMLGGSGGLSKWVNTPCNPCANLAIPLINLLTKFP